MSKEGPWATHTCCSWQMSDRDRFAQVTHDKWANERFAQQNLTKIIFFDTCFVRLKKSDSLIPLFLMSDVSKSLRSLTKNERCERIAQVAHQKWATMSDSLRSLIFLQKRAICSENRWANSQPCQALVWFRSKCWRDANWVFVKCRNVLYSDAQWPPSKWSENALKVAVTLDFLTTFFA